MREANQTYHRTDVRPSPGIPTMLRVDTLAAASLRADSSVATGSLRSRGSMSGKSSRSCSQGDLLGWRREHP
jgi:hypothetical protein